MSDLRDAYANLRQAQSDFGEDSSYEWLRDTADLCFNPPDGDGDEESIYAEAMLAATEFIESLPCECTYTGPPEGDPDPPPHPWDDGDVCGRCKALGRYYDRRNSR